MKNLSELIIQMFVSLTLWGQLIFEITFFIIFWSLSTIASI